MKQLIMVFVGLLLATTQVNATAQATESLIYEGEAMATLSNPLEAYFNDARPKPRKILKATCSAIWRGYLATWEVKGQTLYLNKIAKGSCSGNGADIPLAKIFPGKTSPLKAAWFSGVLIIPEGEMVRYRHDEYESTYEHYRLVMVSSGKVGKVQRLDLDAFQKLRSERFVRYQSTEAYRQRFDKLRASGRYSKSEAEQRLYKTDMAYYLAVAE
ncbi:MAG: hypothetical protein H6999_00550 [Hahellaceae bacterium]|nr:hypothetical protein [Hahellaceae bacterium]MCP5168240.1 hypothetical protein [Hahellaceae bacterium]